VDCIAHSNGYGLHFISLHSVEYEARYKDCHGSKFPGFLDAQNANLFVMYAKARFQIQFGAHFLFDYFE
jgi:hypothetical protein